MDGIIIKHHIMWYIERKRYTKVWYGIMYASSICQYIKPLVTMTQQLWCKYRTIVMFQGQLIAEKEFQWAQFSSPLCMISSSSIFHLQRNEFLSAWIRGFREFKFIIHIRCYNQTPNITFIATWYSKSKNY